MNQVIEDSLLAKGKGSLTSCIAFASTLDALKNSLTAHSHTCHTTTPQVAQRVREVAWRGLGVPALKRVRQWIRKSTVNTHALHIAARLRFIASLLSFEMIVKGC